MSLRVAGWSPAAALAESEILDSSPCLCYHSIHMFPRPDLVKASQMHVDTVSPWALPCQQCMWPALTEFKLTGVWV